MEPFLPTRFHDDPIFLNSKERGKKRDSAIVESPNFAKALSEPKRELLPPAKTMAFICYPAANSGFL